MKNKLSSCGLRFNRHLISMWLLLAVTSVFASSNLVENGKSKFVILLPSSALKSVKLAAKELQTYVLKTTGAKLAISTSSKAANFISLGRKNAEKANLSMDGIKMEGFRIFAKNGKIYIYGNDTMDGKYTPLGGFSRGSLFGTYAFLEKFLKVRWLAPGKDGESIIKNQNITVPDVDIIENPALDKLENGVRNIGKSVILIEGEGEQVM